LTVTSDFFGGCVEIIVGFIFLFNINAFATNNGEFAIILMLCVYGIINGIIRISPYVDEYANQIYNKIGFAFRKKVWDNKNKK
jgi:uncharacterized membrane protein HdeD (DUF308 family)